MSNSIQEFSQIGVAIAGTGFMGWVHAEALRRVGVKLVGVLGSSPEKSEHAAAQYGAGRTYGSYEELLADEAVHSVHINTPNRLHAEMATQALEAGKHVMCEKPLAMTSDESAKLVEVARRFPRQAAWVNYNIRFYPLCIESRERISRGDLGDLYHVTGSYSQDWLLKPTDYNWRVLAKEGGELRAVADIGTHWLDLIQFILLGSDTSKLASAFRERGSRYVQNWQNVSVLMYHLMCAAKCRCVVMIGKMDNQLSGTCVWK